MATNPMQRAKRNSFLLGMVLMLVITGIIIALLFMQLMNMKKAEQELQASYVTVYVLGKDIKSGGEITSSDLTTTQVSKTNSPKDYLTPSDLGDKNTAKITLTAGTVLSKEMVYTDNIETTNDIRKQEYNMIVLPTQLATGDYIDIRLTVPTGEDYIVISKKKVEIPQVAGADVEDTIWMNLNEAEILTMSNAIVDAYRMKGSKFYATTYIEAGVQEKATPTYAVSQDTLSLINTDPNIIENAKKELWSRYNSVAIEQRNKVINNALGNAGDEGLTNAQTKVEESITNTRTTRKQYLDSLSGIN